MEGPRGLRKTEFKSAEQLVNSIFRPNKKSSMIDDFPLLYSQPNLDNLRVYVDKGKVISLVGLVMRDINIFGSRFRVVEIGSVCTALEYRGKGLSSSLLVDAERVSISEDASVMFISGDLGLYRRFGAVGAGIYFMSTLKSDILGEFEPIDVRVAKQADLPLMSAMHSTKRVRFERSVEQFELIFRAISEGQVIPGHTVEIFISECGYIVLTRDDKKNLNCIEHAGDTLCIIGMIKSVLQKKQANSLILHTIGTEYGLNRLLSKICQPMRRNLSGTIKIIDPEKLGKSLTSYFSQRTNVEVKLSNTYTLEIGRHVFELSTEDFTRTIFGSTEKIRETYDEITALTKGVLPIPLPDYGMDYV
ncbi:MAG: GNAT family N-acetyltransferase [Thermotogae bacterium]|nr:GNAT family N-acetyltransferase [Thermotogota bacterium]